MLELVDKTDLKSVAQFGRAGSSPARATKLSSQKQRYFVLYNYNFTNLAMYGYKCNLYQEYLLLLLL